jgi:hypothetical protein
MLKIYKRNGESFEAAVTIRPTPLISISHTPQKNQVGSVGCVYTITLTGTIIAHDGSPNISSVSNGNIQPNATSVFTDTPTSQNIDTGDRLKSIILKQNKLRDLFANDGNKIEIAAIGGTSKKIVFTPNFVSIDFEEGLYIDTCRYTVNLETPLIFDGSGNVYTEALIGSTFSPNNYAGTRTKDEYLRETSGSNKRNISDIIKRWGGIVEDFSDTWSIETDESNGQTYSDSGIVPLSYIVTRNMSATGKMFYDTGGKKYEAWAQALGFIKKTLLEEPQASPNGGGQDIGDHERYKLYPAYSPSNLYASGFLNLPSFYRGYNHVRTLSIDKTAGSCNVGETWLLASGQSHLENYTINITSSADNPLANVKIDGTITGLSEIHSSGYHPNDISKFDSTEDKTPYAKALKKYREISKNGDFGFSCPLYKRATSLLFPKPPSPSSIKLNPQPATLSLAANETNGTITYSLDFDNRPLNLFSGVLSETINVSDNYPGDVFAVIPVMGRKTGPILQYIKGRTEYSRNVDIELILDYPTLSNSGGSPFIQGLPPSSIYNLRTNLLLNKPSLNDHQSFQFRPQLENVIRGLSPASEANVVAYYLRPPVETWVPKEGRYILNISWDYIKAL